MDALPCGEVTRIFDSFAFEDIPAQDVTAKLSVQQSGAFNSECRLMAPLQQGSGASAKVLVNRIRNASGNAARWPGLSGLPTFKSVIPSHRIVDPGRPGA
jgi:hypothetical protein